MDRSRYVVRACVFVTGAVTIALELIASRILTPYVGGSLYVWTAILSITLLALAAGYHMGGRLSHSPRHRQLFVRFPALTALILCLTAAVYPAVLPAVAYDDALTGAFVGGFVILAPTLVLLSALGPLGIAMTPSKGGDRGAGGLFAIGTVGSVVGALAGSFLLLPFMSPAATLVVLAAVLAAVSVAALLLVRDRVTVAGLLPASAVAIAVAGYAVLDAPETVVLGDIAATRVATVRSPHGSIVVVDARHATIPGRVRIYLEENQMQSARGEGVPGEPFRYVAMAEPLVEEMVPPGGRILVLGLAGGTMASDLAAAGYEVEGVDINPDAVDVAMEWFGLDPAEVEVSIVDARLFLNRCRQPYHAIVFDTFSGVTIPDHLVTQEAFAAARGCLADGGIVVANTVLPPLDRRPTRRFLAAMAHGVSAPLAVYEDRVAQTPNRIILAFPESREAPTLRIPHYPTSLFERRPAVIQPRVLTREDLRDVRPLTDHSNDFALGIAGMSVDLGFFPIPAAWH